MATEYVINETNIKNKEVIKLKKYLLLIPLIIAVSSLIFFSSAYDALHMERHEQKFQDIKKSIDLISMEIETLNQNNELIYKHSTNHIKNSIKFIDEEYMVYAVLYTEDLTLVSEKVTKNENPFDPWQYEEFKKAIKSSSSGELKLPYEDGIYENDEMSVYYKWTYTENKERYLLIAGISLYSIENNYSAWITIGTVALIGSLVVTQIWMIIMVLRLNDKEKCLKKEGKL